jgi:glycine cleavage system regulatory protein
MKANNTLKLTLPLITSNADMNIGIYKTNNMAQFFQVKVQFTVEDSKGKVKKQNVLYLVDAQSVTEAEARTVQFLTAQGEQEFEVKAASESPIAQVVTAE